MLNLEKAVNGGIGIAIDKGNVVMNGGKIYGHVGFPSWQCYAVGGDLLGAGVTIIAAGSFTMTAGEIVYNKAPIGAAIYVPNQIYTPIVIDSLAYFENNSSSEEQYPYHYSGGIRHVDARIFFAHTSVGCHILNNFDVNYSSGSIISMKFWDFFPDLNFAKVIYEQLDRKWDAYIDQCEFSNIINLDANRRCIKSIEGVQWLSNLEKIYLNENFIIDISPLGWFHGEIGEGLYYEVHYQFRKLEDTYVSRYMDIGIYDQLIFPIPDPEPDPDPDPEFLSIDKYSPFDNIIKTPIQADIFKYNGRYDKDEEEKQLVWWEAGRNAIRWSVSGFDGYIFQRAIPIPIYKLFPNGEIAKKIAGILHKNIEDAIDITEFCRINLLDLSDLGNILTDVEEMEGLQFLPNLKVLNLKNTGADLSLINKFNEEKKTFFELETKILLDNYF